MWFTVVTARLFIFLSFQPRLAATLLRSCSVANSPIRRVGLAPTLRPASLAHALQPSVQNFRDSKPLLSPRSPVRISSPPQPQPIFPARARVRSLTSDLTQQ